MQTLSKKRITVRMPKALRSWLEQAAALCGMPLGTFVLAAAAEKADHILESKRVIKLACADALLLERMMTHPPMPNAALRRAAFGFEKNLRIQA